MRDRRMAEAITEMASSCPMTALVQLLLDVQQLLALALHDARQGDPVMSRDDLLDVLDVRPRSPRTG